MAENNDKSTYKSLEETIKAEIEEREKQQKTAIQYKKHIRILKYIDELEIFTVRKLFQIMKNNREQITMRTISDYLDTLYNEDYLDLQIIKTKFGRSAHLYYKKNIVQAKLDRAIFKLTAINKEEEQQDRDSKLFDNSVKDSDIQSAAYTKARIDRAEKQEQLKKQLEQDVQEQQEQKELAEAEAIKQEEDHKRKLEDQKKATELFLDRPDIKALVEPDPIKKAQTQKQLPTEKVILSKTITPEQAETLQEDREYKKMRAKIDMNKKKAADEHS